MDNWLEKLVDKDDLQDNLTFAAIFIALYENMVPTPSFVSNSIKIECGTRPS